MITSLKNTITNSKKNARARTHTHTNLKLYKSKGGKTITAFYTFRVKLSDALERKRKKKRKKEEKEEEV